jgi:type I restriction enzyme S subunit
MKIERLGDHATFLSGFAFKSNLFNDQGKGMPIIRIRDVVRGRSETYYSGEFDERYLVTKGDYLIGMDGEFNLARWDSEPALLNQRVCKIDSLSRDIDRGYVGRFLPAALKKIEDATPFVTVKHLSVKALNEIEIPLPPLAEQKRIAAILDKADAIRRKLQQSLRLSDDFLRSVFLDMFGDPKTNSKGWPEEPMSELMSDSKIGIVRASDQFGWDMPVPYVRMDALTNDGAFLPEKVQGTNATPAEIAGYSLKPGDLLFNTRNSKELVGKVAIYPGPEGATFNNNLMRIRFRNGIDPHVICAQFQFPRVQRELEARKQGTTSVFAVYGKNLATLQFLVPPSDLQRDYRKVVDKVSAARQKMKSLLAESESTFSSLQQRAFRGEL